MTQITGTSNTLALSMLQRLLQAGASKASPAASSAGQQTPSAGQNSPGAAALTNCGGPQMSGQTMSGMMQLQTQPPSASDLASQLISTLDSDGDGEVSLDEIQQGLSKAGLNSDVSQAFASLDKDGDGKLNSGELSSAISTAQARHHGGHHSHMAAQMAQEMTSAFDTDGDGSLSIAEITSALGQSSSDPSATQGFAALDADGDGKLSTAELTTAIQSRIQQAMQAYAQQQQAGEESVAAA